MLKSLPHKKRQTVTKSRRIDNKTTLTGGVTAGAVMMLLGQIQRKD